jgi:hypothetical protein
MCCTTSQISQAMIVPQAPRACSVMMYCPPPPPMMPCTCGLRRAASAPMLRCRGDTSSFTQFTCSISLHSFTTWSGESGAMSAFWIMTGICAAAATARRYSCVRAASKRSAYGGMAITPSAPISRAR